MSEFKQLLIEIGTEELPPKALLKLGNAFVDEVTKGLEDKGLTFGEIERYFTPRRLGMSIQDVAVTQADRSNTRKGPAVKAAYDAEGNPTKAALGFARSCGVDLEQIPTVNDGKMERLVFEQTIKGEPTAQLLPGIIEQALRALPIPKRMRWADLEQEFVRPVHWVLLMMDDEIVDCEVMGIKASNRTWGHRFHYPEAICLEHASEYVDKLVKQGHVQTRYESRKAEILKQVEAAAESVNGKASIDDDLLDEVTSLTEWPVALIGSFEEDFLQIPSEALIETMQKNQKYFPVFGKDGALLSHFITVANIDSKDKSQVIAGNERVIRPRFKDAAFFWNQDLKQDLASHIDSLGKVVYQKKLGTILDKSKRMSAFSQQIASDLNENPEASDRASMLCKCDLLTDMVGEFASLQGIMGQYYAKASNESDQVSLAIREHYLPRYAGDALPAEPTGQIVALADKLDTLVGIFAIGQKPTGDKDPFGLRRASLGVLRILIECRLELDLHYLIATAADQYPTDIKAKDAVDDVFHYVIERLKPYYADMGISHSTLDSILATGNSIPLEIHNRVLAVEEFRKLDAADSLSSAHKRCHNILKKAEESVSDSVDKTLFESDAESQLFDSINNIRINIEPLLDTRAYSDVLLELSKLKAPVDRFFEEVMVMSDDSNIRLNRMALLKNLGGLMSSVADISLLKFN